MNTLMQIFQFGADDLDANRNGFLSPRQLALVRSYLPVMQRRMGWLSTIPIILLLLLIFGGGGVFFFSTFGNEIPQDYIPFVIGGLALFFGVAFVLLVGRRVRQIAALNRLKANLDAGGRLRSSTGSVQVRALRAVAGTDFSQAGAGAILEFRVNNQPFAVLIPQTAAMVEAFAHDHGYRVYLLDAPVLPYMVSAEEV